MKRVGPKRVSVFEAGAGDVAFGALGQALRAQRKRSGRSFIASDIALRKEETLRQRGLRESPSNLKLAKGCSINELKKLPAKSQDIVFDSFFLFDYSKGKSSSVREEMTLDYFKEAARVLKPKGRIITLQARFNTQFVEKAARSLGLKMHTVRLSQKQLDESASKWIQLRATKEGRVNILRDNAPDDYSMYMLRESLRRVGINEDSEAHYPVAIILRK